MVRQGSQAPSEYKISKKMRLIHNKAFSGLRAETSIGQRRGTMKMPPLPVSRVVFEIEVKCLPETAAGLIYPASYGFISRTVS